MDFSIIVPTFKEEKHLPLLLESVKNQTYQDFEVIVADHKSPDKTREIAKKYGCKIVDGNKPGPARNAGAKVSKGKWLVFFDADVQLPIRFLEKVEKRLQNKNVVGGTTFVHPLSWHPFDWFFFGSGNIGTWIMQFFKPVAHGFIMIIRADVFKKLKGFDEKLEIGEDFDLAMRVGKEGRFKVIPQTHVQVSVRRFQSEGRARLFWKLIKSTVGIVFLKKRITQSHYDEEWEK